MLTILSILLQFSLANELPHLPTHTDSAPLYDASLLGKSSAQDFFKDRLKNTTCTTELAQKRTDLLRNQHLYVQELNSTKPDTAQIKKLGRALKKERRLFSKLEQTCGPCVTRNLTPDAAYETYSISDGSCGIFLKDKATAEKNYKKIVSSLLNLKQYPRNFKFNNTSFSHVLKFLFFDTAGKPDTTVETTKTNPFTAQIAVDTSYGEIELLPGKAFTYFFENKFLEGKNTQYKDFYLTFESLEEKKIPKSYFDQSIYEVIPEALTKAGEKPKLMKRVELSDVKGLWYIVQKDEFIYLRYRTSADFYSVEKQTGILAKFFNTDYAKGFSNGILLDTLLELTERIEP
jgi:hypothetical protein